MASPSDDSFEVFCGFDLNGTNARTKYFMNETSLTLLPCGELFLISAQSIPLLFFTIINMCFIANIFPRFHRKSIFWKMTISMGSCICTVILITVSVVLSLTTSVYAVRDVQVIEYGILWIIWLVYGAFWAYSLQAQSWSRSRSLSVAHFIASKAFIIIAVNRWLLYGFYDPRCYITLGIVLFQINDVFELPPSLVVAKVEEEMVENSPTYYSDATHFSIIRSLLRTFGLPFFLLAIPRLLSDLFTFAGPILLHLLLNSLEEKHSSNWSWYYGLLMTFFSLLAVLFSTHFNFAVQKMSLRVRVATVTSIYDKLMRVPLSQLCGHSTGQILNFVSSDVDRIVNFCNSFHAFWSLPVQLIIALFLLYREVGLAYLAGLAAAIILIPINKWITNSIGKRSELMMSCKDERVKLMTETMQGIRAVKLSAWEDFFEKKIGDLRKKELVHLKARKYLDAVCVYLWASAPLLITLAILASYTLILHEKLTAAKVFTSLALVNILIMPLNAFPWVLNGLVEAFVSLRRLDGFFLLHNMEYNSLYSYSEEPDQVLTVEKAAFAWKEGSPAIVKDISFTGRRSGIIGVGGPVGSGKSTLLLGLLGEAVCLEGGVKLRQLSLTDGIAYVGQTCWLSRGTIRENILSGLLFEKERYEKIIEVTCLEQDIKAMPRGDEYEISDNGSSLSGGQRVRVALARALYQDNSVYLLDDPFASLDRKVADSIWNEAIVHFLKARGKLVVMVSHDSRLLARADFVIMLTANGRTERSGPGKELFGSQKEHEAEDEGSEGDGEVEDEEQQTEYVLLQDEEKQEGSVGASVYASYARAMGKFMLGSILMALLIMQIFKNAADWWLTRWTNGQSNGTELSGVRDFLLAERQELPMLNDAEFDRSLYFLTVYSCIAGANTIFTLIRAFLFALGGVVAGATLHEKLLIKLLAAPLSWWDRTPTGRVINRICADVYTVDDSLPFQLNILLASLFNLVGALALTLFGLPLLTPLVICLLIIYYFIQQKYRMTTVELKRLSSLSLSPLYSLLNDSVNGLATIRAHRFVDNVSHTLRERLTLVLRTLYSSLAASSWLSVRLCIIAVTVVSCNAFAAIIQHRLGFLDSGLVGLAVTYSLSMTSLLNGLLGSFIETEKEMVSVERIDEYVEGLPQESQDSTSEPPVDVRGRLELSSVSVRYEPHLPLALSAVTVRVDPGQKVAIIGRTGSGKSTLFQALLRAVKLDSGCILVDGVDISTLPLKPLRKMFGVVPQSPLIFSGTLAENLLVDNTRTDGNTLSHIVRVAQLDKLLERIGGLDGEIEEGGKNLSQGEKQIISLTRILLNKPRIVLVDEATAHMDAKTRDRLFSLLAANLPLCTLLSIVHRPHSLSDYDYVIRMDAGRVLGYGPPREEDVQLFNEES